MDTQEIPKVSRSVALMRLRRAFPGMDHKAMLARVEGMTILPRLPRLKLARVDGSRGAPMGRFTQIPADREAPVKLRMERLRFVDGCYDRGGAYWGLPANVYHAEGVDEVPIAVLYGEPYRGVPLLFVRANSRTEAKALVRTYLPNARFFR